MKKINERGVNLVMKRKLLVLLMAILVVMAMMPTAAFAANGGIIDVSGNVTVSKINSEPTCNPRLYYGEVNVKGNATESKTRLTHTVLPVVEWKNYHVIPSTYQYYVYNIKDPNNILKKIEGGVGTDTLQQWGWPGTYKCYQTMVTTNGQTNGTATFDIDLVYQFSRLNSSIGYLDNNWGGRTLHFTITQTVANQTTYTVTYTDGVDDETVFEDQVTSGLKVGNLTPAFRDGTPMREGYKFTGWNPEVADTVTEDATYEATWQPDAPKDDEIREILGENAVEVKCTATMATHTQKTKTYGLLAGSYTAGPVQGDASTGYTVEVTVESAIYVSDFDIVTEKTHTPTNESKNITLKYNSKSKTWSVDPASQKPIKFDVVCKETPAPSDKDIIALEGAVIVDCTKQDTHLDKTYQLVEDSYLVGQVQGNKCTVSIWDAKPYIEKYNTDVAGTHQLKDQKQNYAVQLSYENGKWTVAEAAHLYVECEETSTEPEIKKEDIEFLLYSNAICVDCTTNAMHADKLYGYEGEFAYSPVQDGKCTVTLQKVNEAEYIQKYSTDITEAHTKDATESKLTVELEHDGVKWTIKTPAHIYAKCETGGGDEPIITPDGPTKNQVEELLFGRIIVHCNTTTAHPDKSYGPLEGGYEIEKVKGNASTGYYVNVNVTAAAYIAEFSKDFGTHTQAFGDPADRNITLVYEDGAWRISDSANAIFYAVCQTGGGDNPSGGGNAGGNAGGETVPGGDDGNGGTVTPVAPTNPTEPVVPEDPDDGKTGANDQANPHEVPKTGDNLPMNLVFYAFLAASAAMAMRKITKKESK